MQRWVTLHGIAINVEPELANFAGIVPCGVTDTRYGVTTTMHDADVALRREFEALFGKTVDYAVGKQENNSPERRSLNSSSVPAR